MDPAQTINLNWQALYRFAYRMTGRHEQAQDIAQESFLRLARGGPRDLNEESLRRWLFVVARNLCLSYLRRAGHHAEISWDEKSELPSTWPSPAEEGMNEERTRLVRSAIGRLSPDLREALILREYEEYSYLEIADLLGIPIGTVRSRIARARAVLATELYPLKDRL